MSGFVTGYWLSVNRLFVDSSLISKFERNKKSSFRSSGKSFTNKISFIRFISSRNILLPGL
ncbi:MAG: hypothetical protein DRJ02_07935 [Bacteroidetes bacterium]|nr:MAG: hypothetical protein DRJ02_07935 [Bacteroidota bacterium]